MNTKNFELEQQKGMTTMKNNYQQKGLTTMRNNYLPEGKRIDDATNKHYLYSIDRLIEAKLQEIILEARCTACDCNQNLIVDLGGIKGVIPRSEGALGIDEGKTKDIALVSRVGKQVCFTVKAIEDTGAAEPVVILSRKRAQELCMENYISNLKNGDVIPAKVTHLEQFGCFVDIGCGIVSMIPINLISVSRISHSRDRFYIGQDIFAAVKERMDDKICLTHKELLGTWEENAAKFSSRQTVLGIVRSVESYGIFVELAPNLTGLAECRDDVKEGDVVSVYIRSIIPEKGKVKLNIVNILPSSCIDISMEYCITDGNIEKWTYLTKHSDKPIETIAKAQEILPYQGEPLDAAG